MRTKGEPGREGICKRQAEEWVPIDEAKKELLERQEWNHTHSGGIFMKVGVANSIRACRDTIEPEA